MAKKWCMHWTCINSFDYVKKEFEKRIKKKKLEMEMVFCKCNNLVSVIQWIEIKPKR